MRGLFVIFFLVLVAISTAALAQDENTNSNSHAAYYNDPSNPDNYLNDRDPDERDRKLERSRRAQKVIATLKAFNLDHPYLTDTAIYVDQNTYDGYFYLANEPIGSSGMKVQLRYEMDGLNGKNLQLNITGDETHYNLTGSTEGVLLRYRLAF